MCAGMRRQRKPRVRSSRLFQQLLHRGVDVLHQLTAPLGFAMHSFRSTSLFPPDLNTDLDTIKLAATPGIKSCFLRVKLGLSVFAAANFAKALRAAWIYTVGDFLCVYHMRWPTHLRRFVEALDRCLAQYPDLPENHHFPPGTCGGCEVARA